MRVHKGTALLAGVAAVTLALTACSSSSGKKTAGGGNTSTGKGQLIFGESADFMENLFPLITAGNVTSTANLEIRVLDAAYQVLPNIRFKADPDQITSGTSSVVNGQQVVDIKINPKAVWADGQPITSADYIFSAQTQKSNDPKKGGCAALISDTGFSQIEKATPVSSKEVKFTFIKGKSYPDWEGLFGGASGIILSKHVMDQGNAKANCAYLTKGWPTAGGIPLGAMNGPWMMTKKNIDVPNKTITLTPNPKYWGAKPKLARLVDVNIGSDPDTNVKALQNQEVNMIYPQPQIDLLPNLKKLSNVTTGVNFGVDFEHLDFNTEDPLLKHIEIRQALAYAIDRPALVASTVGKFSDRASVLGNRLLLGTQPGYVDHSGAYAKQDIAKAKSLLQGIGCTMGSNGYFTCFGKPLALAIMTSQQNPLRDQTIATIGAEVKAAGIKITENANPDIFKGAGAPTSLVSGGFQIGLFAWVGNPALSANNALYLSPAGGGKGQNYTQAGTAQIDKILDQMSTATSTAAEVPLANQADQLLWAQMYSLPLYQKPTLLAYDKNFKGVGDNGSSSGPLWNSETFTAG